MRDRSSGKAQWKKAANKRRHYEKNRAKYPNASESSRRVFSPVDIFEALMARFNKKWMKGNGSGD